MTSSEVPEAEGPVNRPTGFFEQPFWTVLGLLVVCAGPLILLAGISGYVISGEEIIEAGTSIPIDVHPTRDLFRLAADLSR